MPLAYYTKFLAVFLVFIGILYLILKLLRQVQGGPALAKSMQLTERLGITNGVFLAIITVRDQAYLIGIVNNKSITILDKL